jgi:large subunit ribosomal protein L4
MIQVDILNRESKSTGKIDLPPDIFGVKVNNGLLHEVVRNYLANQRQGNASTKTRGLVRGGGRKPYKQKGSGRARAGSNRSPIWKGGGTAFGPLKKDYSYKVPKKKKWAALGMALSAKYTDGEIVVVDDIPVTEPKTKDMTSFLKELGLKNVLIILPEYSRPVKLAARNIPQVDVAVAGSLNVYEILAHDKLLLTRQSVEKMKEAYLE